MKLVKEGLGDILKPKEFEEGFTQLIKANEFNNDLKRYIELGARSLFDAGYSPNKIEEIMKKFFTSNEINELIKHRIAYEVQYTSVGRKYRNHDS